MALEFRILGPLEVRDGDRGLVVRGEKQRLLLARLLLSANRVVSTDRLVEAIWGDAPPDTPDKALQMHVSQLRKLLEPERAPGRSGHVLVTQPPGYVLHVDEGRLASSASSGRSPRRPPRRAPAVTRRPRAACATRSGSGAARRSPISAPPTACAPTWRGWTICASARSRTASTRTWRSAATRAS
jgi:DNA-binding winged helix-turn-helix (wHTH) protein